MKSPELLDVVELLVNLPEDGLRVGTQGTIVECYGDDAYEVEFVNGAGDASRERPHPIMSVISSRLVDSDMQAVAEYLAGMRAK